MAKCIFDAQFVDGGWIADVQARVEDLQLDVQLVDGWQIADVQFGKSDEQFVDREVILDAQFVDCGT